MHRRQQHPEDDAHYLTIQFFTDKQKDTAALPVDILKGIGSPRQPVSQFTNLACLISRFTKSQSRKHVACARFKITRSIVVSFEIS